MRDLSKTITLTSDNPFSENSEETRFPTVTVPLFENTASHTRQQTGFASVSWAPLIREEDVSNWLQHTKNDIGWMEESREYDLATEKNLEREDYTNEPIVPFVYDSVTDTMTGVAVKRPESEPKPWAPLWQVSPPPAATDFVNQNLFHLPFIQEAFEAIQECRGMFSSHVPKSSLYSLIGSFSRLSFSICPS